MNKMPTRHGANPGLVTSCQDTQTDERAEVKKAIWLLSIRGTADRLQGVDSLKGRSARFADARHQICNRKSYNHAIHDAGQGQQDSEAGFCTTRRSCGDGKYNES